MPHGLLLEKKGEEGGKLIFEYYLKIDVTKILQLSLWHRSFN